MRITKEINQNHVEAEPVSAQKGITLIALVITIIVMLILVAVTISMAINGGLFDYAGKATGETQNAINDEQTLANGKINVDGVWYDSIKDYINNIPSEEGNEGIISEEITGADGQFKYVKLKNGRIQICRYIGSDTAVVIPATYDGYTVYSVGNIDAGTSSSSERYNIFGSTNKTTNSTIKSLTISEGIRVIETAAFARCTAIVGELKLPSTLKEIGYAAFDRCKGLTGNADGDVIIPEGVTIIGNTAFQQCTGFKGDLILPSTLEIIDDYAFNHCYYITGDLDIPEGVTKIGESAFNRCDNVDGFLTLPSTLVELGDFAFNHCGKLQNTTVTIPKSLKLLGRSKTEGTHIFYDFANTTMTKFIVEDGNTEFKAGEDGVLYTADGTRLISYPTSRLGNTYEIPEGVTIIDELAFSKAGAASNDPDACLKKIILPNSYVLTTQLPSNYLNVGSNLAVGVYKKSGIEEVEVKADNPNYKSTDGIVYSKDGTILWYVPVKKAGDIIVSEGVTTIKSGAFYGSDERILTSVTIPASVTEIEATELTELKNLVQQGKTVTFAEGCVYQFNESGSIVKNS